MDRGGAVGLQSLFELLDQLLEPLSCVRPIQARGLDKSSRIERMSRSVSQTGQVFDETKKKKPYLRKQSGI